MNDNLVKRTPPKPRIAISKLMIIALGALVALSLVIAIRTRKQPTDLKKSEIAESKASVSNTLFTLPNSYADIPPPPPPPKAIVEYVTAPMAKEKEISEYEAQRQKRAADARRSPLQFTGLPVENRSDVSRMNSQRGAQGNGAPTRPDGLNARDDANRQDEKLKFLDEKRGVEVYLQEPLIRPASRYQLMAGTMLPGVLITGLNSDLPGQILGQISQNIYDTVTGNYLLVPQGTKVLGQYDSRVVYGQERLLVVWTRLIFPSGKSISLEGMPGVDLSGNAGLSDLVNNHYLKLLTGVLLSSSLSAGAQVAQGRTYNTVDPTYGQLAAQGAAQNINEVGQEITRRNLAVQPTLEVRPGFRFNVFVHKDMILEPYET